MSGVFLISQLFSIVVQCPVGMFHNFLEGTCTPCPFGTYQFKGGQLSCEVCPDHTSTVGESSKSKDDCKPQCVPGMISKFNGVIPCETCLLVGVHCFYSHIKSV